MKEKEMTLYICPDCELLLVRLEKKYASYLWATLDESGQYDGDAMGDEQLVSYCCPMCGNEYVIDDAGKLQTVTVPIKVTKKLIALWEQKYANKDTQKHGIPLTDPELKELLVEYLL